LIFDTLIILPHWPPFSPDIDKHTPIFIDLIIDVTAKQPPHSSAYRQRYSHARQMPARSRPRLAIKTGPISKHFVSLLHTARHSGHNELSTYS
jgi:hypothetical protein